MTHNCNVCNVWLLVVGWVLCSICFCLCLVRLRCLSSCLRPRKSPQMCAICGCLPWVLKVNTLLLHASVMANVTQLSWASPLNTAGQSLEMWNIDGGPLPDVANRKNHFLPVLKCGQWKCWLCKYALGCCNEFRLKVSQSTFKSCCRAKSKLQMGTSY